MTDIVTYMVYMTNLCSALLLRTLDMGNAFTRYDFVHFNGVQSAADLEMGLVIPV